MVHFIHHEINEESLNFEKQFSTSVIMPSPQHTQFQETFANIERHF